MGSSIRKPAILVVEDNAALLGTLVRMLSGVGGETLAAQTAVDALALVRLRQGAFDLAIVDIVMPGVSGLDLGTDLDREYPELKILYISGYVHSVAADALARRTPDRMLLKPFTRRELVERVRLLLDSPSRRGPGQAADSPFPEVGTGTLG